MSEKKTVTKVCTCENCGNEAEMMVTCSLPEAVETAHSHDVGPNKGNAAGPQKTKGTATCTHCGNEADMWIDI